MASASGLDAGQRTLCRDRVVQAAMLGYHHKAEVHYTWDRRRWSGIAEHRSARLGQFPGHADCSSYDTWCLWNGLYLGFGVGDVVNGYRWQAGNTASMLQHGKPVRDHANALRGDVVLYGRPGDSRHAAIVVAVKAGKPMVISHGSDAGPFYVPYDYRSDVLSIRRYI